MRSLARSRRDSLKRTSYEPICIARIALVNAHIHHPSSSSRPRRWWYWCVLSGDDSEDYLTDCRSGHPEWGALGRGLSHVNAEGTVAWKTFAKNRDVGTVTFAVIILHKQRHSSTCVRKLFSCGMDKLWETRLGQFSLFQNGFAPSTITTGQVNFCDPISTVVL